MRGYKSYKVLSSLYASMLWNGTRHHLLVDSATTIPGNLELITFRGQYVTPGTGSVYWDFYSPDVYDIVSEMDGLVSGNATINASVSASCGTGAYVRIDSIDVTLYAVDASGISRTLADETVDSMGLTIDKGDSDEWGIVFWLPITRQHIEIHERLVTRITFNYTAYDPTSYSFGINVGLGTDPAADEMTLDVPFVV